MWKLRDCIALVKASMQSNMKRAAHDVVIDEARAPCQAWAPCIRFMFKNPVKKGWTFWIAVDQEVRYTLNIFVDDDSMHADDCRDLLVNVS